jgi:hypothetical protein
MENIPFFYPPRVPGKYPPPLKIIGGKAAAAVVADEPEAVETATAVAAPPPPKTCPIWAVRASPHCLNLLALAPAPTQYSLSLPLALTCTYSYYTRSLTACRLLLYTLRGLQEWGACARKRHGLWALS